MTDPSHTNSKQPHPTEPSRLQIVAEVIGGLLVLGVIGFVLFVLGSVCLDAMAYAEGWEDGLLGGAFLSAVLLAVVHIGAAFAQGGREGSTDLAERQPNETIEVLPEPVGDLPALRAEQVGGIHALTSYDQLDDEVELVEQDPRVSKRGSGRTFAVGAAIVVTGVAAAALLLWPSSQADTNQASHDGPDTEYCHPVLEPDRCKKPTFFTSNGAVPACFEMYGHFSHRWVPCTDPVAGRRSGPWAYRQAHIRVSLRPRAEDTADGLAFRAPPGRENRVHIRRTAIGDPGDIVVTDRAGKLDAGPGCSGGGGRVVCHQTLPDLLLGISLGDKDDRLILKGLTPLAGGTVCLAGVYLGAGNDYVDARHALSPLAACQDRALAVPEAVS